MYVHVYWQNVYNAHGYNKRKVPNLEVTQTAEAVIGIFYPQNKTSLLGNHPENLK